MELKDYAAAVRAGWKQIVAGVVMALLVGGALAAWTASAGASTDPGNTATRKIFIAIERAGQQVGRSPDPGPTAQSQLGSYAELVGGGLMAEAISDSVGFEVTPGTVVATPLTGTSVMTVSVTLQDRDRADAIADASVEVLPDIIEQVDVLGPQGDATVRVTTISSATTEDAVLSSTAPTRILLLAALIGLGFGLGWALFTYPVAPRSAPASTPRAGQRP